MVEKITIPSVPEGTIWYIEYDPDRDDDDAFLLHAPQYQGTTLLAESIDLLLEEQRPGGWCGPTARIYFSLAVIALIVRQQNDTVTDAVEALLDDLRIRADMLRHALECALAGSR